MSDEQQTPSTEPEAVAEQAQPATPVEAPKPEPKDETDYRAAYVGLQRTVNKLHARNEGLQRTNAEIAEALKAVKETTNLLATQSLGPDQVKALEERQQLAQERAAAFQAAQSLEASVQATIGLVDRMMASSGLSEEDRKAVYLGAQGATGIQEWTDAVHALASQRLAKAIEARVKEAEGKVTAKQSAEIKAEAQALAEQAIKESGIDKVDTARGTAPASRAQRIAEMDPSSDEFKKFYNDVLAGRVK